MRPFHDAKNETKESRGSKTYASGLVIRSPVISRKSFPICTFEPYASSLRADRVLLRPLILNGHPFCPSYLYDLSLLLEPS